MKVLYWSSGSIGFLSIWVAIGFNGVESALDAWWGLASIFSGGLLGLLFLGLISPKLSKTPAILGVISGLMVIAWVSLAEFFPQLSFPIIHKNWAIVLGTMAIIIIGFFTGILMSKKSTHYLSD